MKIVFLSLILLTLSGCTVTRQAHVSEIDVPNAVVRLTWQQMILQDARTDPYVARGWPIMLAYSLASVRLSLTDNQWQLVACLPDHYV